MITQIEQHLITHWEKYFPYKPQNIQSLLLTSAQGKKAENSKCTVLIFINNKDIPDLVCKFARVKNSNGETKIKNEISLLQKSNNSHELFFPQSFEPFSINGKIVSVEQYMPGQSIKDSLVKYVNMFEIKDLVKLKGIIQTDIDDVKNLILNMRIFPINDISNSSAYIDTSLKEIDKLNDYLNLSEEYYRDVQTVIDKYQTNTFRKPRFIHSDLTPSNIIRSNDNKLSLIDFEFSDISIHEFIDPSRFIFYYFQTVNDLDVLPYRSYLKNFYHFFYENEFLVSQIKGFYQSIGLSDLKYQEYLLLFLICNLKLQFEEVGTQRISQQFLILTSQLIVLIIDVLNDRIVNIPDQASDDLYSDWTELELKQELKKLRSSLNAFQQQQENNSLYIQHCLDVINEKDNELGKNIDYIEKCHETIVNKDHELAQNIEYINKCHETIKLKEEELAKNAVYLENCRNETSIWKLQVENLMKDQLNYETRLQAKERELSSLNAKLSDLDQKYKKTWAYRINKLVKKRP